MPTETSCSITLFQKAVTELGGQPCFRCVVFEELAFTIYILIVSMATRSQVGAGEVKVDP